jgi:hypothetical protein
MNFTVISSNPNQSNGFVTKLKCTTTKETPFGTKTKTETYYVSGTKQLAIDSTLDINLNDWSIKEYPSPYVDDNGNTIMCKWLHLK